MASGSGRLETKNFTRATLPLFFPERRLAKSISLAVERSNANNQCVLPFDIELCIATSQVRRHQWCWNISPQALITRPLVASANESTTKRIWNCRRNNNKIKTGFFFPPPKSSMHKITYWFFARINSIICFVKLWRSILIYTWSLLLTWTFFSV